MGLYLRKGVRVGLFRFNLSKSGIGVSTGIKGLRVGKGPRGNYIHMGRGGLYYRKTLSDKSPKNTPNVDHSGNDSHEFDIPLDTYETLQAIDSGDIGKMVDSSSEDLVNELNSNRKKIRLWPIMVCAGIIGTGIIVYYNSPPWGVYTAIIVSLILTVLAAYRDLISKTVVILYNIEDEFQETYELLHRAFDAMGKCKAKWHLEAQGNVKDKKYHAGADSLVKRSLIDLSLKNPPYVKTNVATPSIPVGSQTLYFFPDKVLVFEPNGVGAVSYENLSMDISATKFIEDGHVPRDAKIIDYTWKYVNKRGGPDKRFKDNPQIPIALYEDLHFSSTTGLNERIQLSRTGIASSFVEAIQKVGSVNRAYV